MCYLCIRKGNTSEDRSEPPSTTRTMNARELAKWIKEIVDFQVEHADQSWTYRQMLDFDFAVHIGWSNGFDPKDDTCIHATDNPKWCLCIKIAENISDEYDWCYMPWNTETGDVWDTDTSLFRGKYAKDYYNMAKWLLGDYRKMRRELAKGTITFGN